VLPFSGSFTIGTVTLASVAGTLARATKAIGCAYGIGTGTIRGASTGSTRTTIGNGTSYRSAIGGSSTGNT
jgi:hypothetical protein